MNYLERVDIKGFWGDRNFSVSFDPHVNFLIGVNGSGKTTVINLVAAALAADFLTLDRLPFRSIFLQLGEVHGNRKASIEIEKKVQERSPYPSIVFSIKDKATDKAVEYALDHIEEERIFRGPAHDYNHWVASSRFKQGRYNRIRPDIIEHLAALVKVSWLSIHRAAGLYRSQEDRSYESTIDQKLDELSNEFVKYFSLLDKQAAVETDKFQQTIFLSLLSEEKKGKAGKSVFPRKLDPEKEKQALIEIFRLFKLDEKKFLKRTENHFRLFADAKEKLLKNNAEIELDDFSILIGTDRIHSVVQDWNKLTEKQKEIYKPRDTFLSVINSLIQKKQLQINERNVLEAKTQSAKIFSLKHLSSGEKQLIIILGQALLQQSTVWIYIADEPELSLHVNWQESLVRNIRNVNPNAQIIFATHSPDIVSTFDQCIVDMEKLIS